MTLVTTWKASNRNVFFFALALCLAMGSLCSPVLAAGSFSLNASQLQFNTNTGGQATQQITATNNTNYPLTLVVATTGSSNFALTSSPTVTVDGYGNSTINVTYSPLAIGSDTGMLRVISSTGDTMTVPLYGTATTGSNLHLSFSPSGTINLNTRVGVPDTQKLTITNTGTTASAVSLGIAGTGASNYSLSSSNLALAAGGSSTVNIVYNPTASGSSNAMLTVRTGTGDTTSIDLHGTANAAMSFQLVPSGTIVFNTRPGQRDTQTVTLRNTTGAVSSFTLTPSGSNLFNGSLTSATVLGNGSTTIPITFMSNTNGSANGSILVRNLTTGDTASIPLVGHVNFAPNLNISTPTTVSYQSRMGVQECLPISFSDNNASGATISNLMVTGDTNDFKLSGSGNLQLNAYGSGSTTVCFTPTFQQGQRVANLVYSFTGTTDTSLHGTGSVTLIGTATGRVDTADVTFFQTTRVLNFNNVQVGQTECQTVVLSNPTANAVTIDSAYMSGNGSTQFQVSGGSMLNVAPGSVQTINVCYNPNVAGNTNTTLNLAYTGVGGTTGTINVQVNANAVDSLNNNGGEFTNCLSVRHAIGVIGPILRGGTDTSSLYLTNRTNGTLTISGATVGGTNSSSFSTSASQFPMTLAAGQQGTVNVAFTPDNSITGSAYSGTLNLSLSGTGVQCQNVTIHLNGVAVPGSQNGKTDVNLGTGLTSNGTTVIPITNSTTNPCVVDTVNFTNTTSAAMTISALMLGSNSDLTVLGTNMGNISASTPVTLSAGGVLQAYVQFCNNNNLQAGTVTSDQLFVQTSQSIQPQQFTVQATQVAPAAGVASNTMAPVNIAIMPNPTADRVEIRVNQARAANVEVFDLLGNVLQTMHGTSVINWDSRDAAGTVLPSGVYIVRVTGTDANGASFRESRQLVINR